MFRDGAECAYIRPSVRGQTRVVARLLELRADVDLVGGDGARPLAAAVAERQWMIARRLADARADLEDLRVPGDDRPLLLRLAAESQWDTLVHLARSGADVCAREPSGLTMGASVRGGPKSRGLSARCWPISMEAVRRSPESLAQVCRIRRVNIRPRLVQLVSNLARFEQIVE